MITISSFATKGSPDESVLRNHHTSTIQATDNNSDRKLERETDTVGHFQSFAPENYSHDGLNDKFCPSPSNEGVRVGNIVTCWEELDLPYRCNCGRDRSGSRVGDALARERPGVAGDVGTRLRETSIHLNRGIAETALSTVAWSVIHTRSHTKDHEIPVLVPCNRRIQPRRLNKQTKQRNHSHHTKPWTAFTPSPRQLHSTQSICSAAPASVSKNLTGQQQSKSPSSPNRIILPHPLPHLAPADIIPPMQPEIHTNNPAQERSEVSQTTTITTNAAKKRTRGDSGVIDGKSGRGNGDLTNYMRREVSTIWAHRKLIGFFGGREGRGGKGGMVGGEEERTFLRGTRQPRRGRGQLVFIIMLAGGYYIWRGTDLEVWSLY
ncbi:hypothetical protein K440DRAFT_638877 [Wilcoxina mikolae CBS 423.85]|nr:hypothetical protein K440DRAFT_638877 [Wilcoxina mikolae CBS 423.85]